MSVLLPLVLAALFPLAAVGQTEPRDKQALLAFKSAVIDIDQMLAGWDATTDPCIDQWRGVQCTCLTEFEDSNGQRVPICAPLDPAFVGVNSRVLQLNLGDVRITGWDTLGGNLPPALGSLTALRILNLKNNNFTGQIPSEWYALSNLEQLILSGNNITGPLPNYLANLPRLKYVYLEDNNLSGQVPSDWCFSAWWRFDVRNNPGLCDELPSCMYDRIYSFEGTSLIDPVGDRDRNMGGYCGVAPPTCRRTEDACWVQVPKPAYWTDSTKISFSFPDFPSVEGGVPATYDWRLGTSPGSGDISDWRPFTGRNVTQSAEVPSERSDGKAATTQVVTQVVHITDGELPPGIALRQAGQYYVTVRGTNAAGTLQALQVVSDAVTVDATPPVLPPGSAVYSSQYFSNSLAQTDIKGIGVSWDEFVDPESGIEHYAYQVFQYVRRPDSDGGDEAFDYTGEPMTSVVRVDDDVRAVYVSKLSLSAGNSYFVRVYATNGAGAETYRDGAPVAVMNEGDVLVVNNTTMGLAVSKVVIIIAILVGACSAAVAVITFYFARERYRTRTQKSRKYRGQMRNLRQLLNSLVERVGAPEKGDPLDELRKLKNVAFVITDLEGSTKIAAAAPRAYEWVQEAHDALLRDLIAAYGGYEINTEGDAFHVAFKDVATAVHFCMEVQYQMMEVEWPKEVLKLPECREVKASDDSGGWAFRGPRVRMGIHWAEEGSVVQHIHALTKHRVFTGPAFQVTRELCESGRGGQVLMTHAVWERLKENMAAAAFPVVEQLGRFRFAALPDELWVYQVTRLLAKPLNRPNVRGLQGAEEIEPGGGLSIVSAPNPRSGKGDLVFVSCRLALECCLTTSTGDGIPPDLHFRLYQIFASSAMQFSGFTFRMSESRGCYLIAFASPIDALRFCHTAQLMLMYTHWPVTEYGEWCGTDETSTDGKALFQGPRVAMAIHESNDYTTRPVPRLSATPDGSSAYFADFVGPAEEAARVLSEVAHGGQVVLSEPAWKAVQDQLPGQPQVISLGTYALQDPLFPIPAMLMEVMPQALAKRSFPPPRRAQMVEPGYRDAPSPANDVAIAQMRVVKPKEVADAEAAGEGITDDAIIRIITAYNVALARAVRAARSLLRTHGGYECKEPEPGKLTVAFTSLDSAVRWGAALQSALLDLPWPQEVLSWEECREVRESEEEEGLGLDEAYALEMNDPSHKGAISVPASTLDSLESDILQGIDGSGVTSGGLSHAGGIVWRGLRVRVGIACGVPTSKAPLNTGRADYFGTIPNLAARLMSLAQSGQVLVDGAKVLSLRPVNWREDGGILPGNDTFPQGIEIYPLGQFAIKGLDDPRSVYQALPVSLAIRTFIESPALVKPSTSSMSRRISSLRTVRSMEASALEAAAGGGNLRRPGIFSSISRTGSVSAAKAGSGGPGHHSGPNPSTPHGGGTQLNDSFSALLIPQHHSRSTGHFSGSGTSSQGGGGGGSGGASSWMARTLLGMRDRRHSQAMPSSGPTSGTNTPNSSFGPYVSVPIPAGASRGASAHELEETHVRPSQGTFTGSLGQSSYYSDAGIHRKSSIRDVSDWSCPGSRRETPTLSTSVPIVDHWDASLAMETAFKSDGLAASGGSDGGQVPQARLADPFGSLVVEPDPTDRRSPQFSRMRQHQQQQTAQSQQPRAPQWSYPSQQVGSSAEGSLSLKDPGSLGWGEGGNEGKGLQFAQQVAQLFVDRRKRSMSAKDIPEQDPEKGEEPESGSPTKAGSSWQVGKLVGKLRGSKETGSKVSTGGSSSPTKSKSSKGNYLRMN